MENELMETKIAEEENNEVVNYEEPSSSKGGIMPLLGVGCIIAAGAIGTFIYKNRAKLEARRIEKLRKKGYVITKMTVVDSDDEEIVSETEIDEE